METEKFGAYLSPEQLAEYVQRPVSWVYSAARRNRIPKCHVGGRLRFRKKTIDAWIQRTESWPKQFGPRPERETE